MPHTRWIVWLAAILALLMLLLPVLLVPAESNHQQPPPLGIFESAAELVTLKMPVAQVIELSKEGYLGGTRLTGTVRGELLIGSRLDNARVIRVDHEARCLVVELPQPELLHFKLMPTEQSPIVQRAGLWKLAPISAHEAELAHQSAREAEQLLTRGLELSGAIHAAQRHTESVLSELFVEQGWRVEVRWTR